MPTGGGATDIIYEPDESITIDYNTVKKEHCPDIPNQRPPINDPGTTKARVSLLGAFEKLEEDNVRHAGMSDEDIFAEEDDTAAPTVSSTFVVKQENPMRQTDCLDFKSLDAEDDDLSDGKIISDMLEDAVSSDIDNCNQRRTDGVSVETEGASRMSSADEISTRAERLTAGGSVTVPQDSVNAGELTTVSSLHMRVSKQQTKLSDSKRTPQKGRMITPKKSTPKSLSKSTSGLSR